jgi:4-hydroxybutyryl-CoA dehydratase / vinylacetyl-CoA-Delta-isomerase
MSLKNKEDYINSLKKQDLKVYLFGKTVTDIVNNPYIRPSINSASMTYDLADKEEYKDLFIVKSHISGKDINRFTHIHQSTEDLIKKVKMLRLLGQKTASCFQRCVGMDALNTLYSVTFEMDSEYGTAYHKRFLKFLDHVQNEDLIVDGAMTDPKGDRGFRPTQQKDPDMYLHIVKETPEGLIVRGAKAHQTGCLNSHEILVMPTLALVEEEKDYAVSFAVPVTTKGLIYIYGRQSSDTRKLEEGVCGEIDRGNLNYGGQEVLIIFKDVFVPWDRVFMCREYKYSSELVERFAGYHRQSYGGCKVGVGDVLIGAACLIAEYNGVSKASHIKDKIVEMIHLNETIFSCGIACSYLGTKTSSGNYLVDLLLANICKQNVTRFPYEISRIIQDIAGGKMVTLPSAKDFKNPEVGPYLKKYLKGIESIPTENRVRILRFIENMTLGSGAVCYLTESMHGAGSPQAQRIMISRLTDLEFRKNLAKKIAGISEVKK